MAEMNICTMNFGFGRAAVICTMNFSSGITPAARAFPLTMNFAFGRPLRRALTCAARNLAYAEMHSALS
jgi:hypothetical protein